MPKVSICIPAFNQIEKLKKVLDSIFFQTFTDYEIIITDDSPDNIVSDFIKFYYFDKKIIYHKNIPSLGATRNWNASIEKATGEYIKIMHHDDYFADQNCLFEFVDVLKNNPNICFAFSSSKVDFVSSKKQSIYYPSKILLDKAIKNPKILFFSNLIGPPSSVIHRKSNFIKYDTNLKWMVDIDFYIQWFTFNNSVRFIEKPLIIVSTDYSESLTSSCEKDIYVDLVEHIYLFKKYKLQNELFSYSFKNIRYFNDLFGKYHVNSYSDFKKYNFAIQLPIYFVLFFGIKNILNKITKR